MACPLPTRNRNHPLTRVGGFTLLEVMMVTFISSFVFAGVLSAYIFLGRGLMRQSNAESLESRSRLALYYFTLDVSTASSITAVNPGTQVTGTQMILVAAGSGTVTYSCDWSQGASKGTLQRQVGSNTPLVLLTNLTGITFSYFDMGGSTVTVPSTTPSYSQLNIKQVMLSFTSSAGYAASGAQSNLTVVSPRVIMKNKPLIEDPNDTN